MQLKLTGCRFEKGQGKRDKGQGKREKGKDKKTAYQDREAFVGNAFFDVLVGSAIQF
jgi:hypothetical protein